jgi:hypothetical protein
MSAVTLSDCENIQEHASKIQGYENNFNVCADNSTSTMPQCKDSYYVLHIPTDDDWRFFTQLMHDKINCLADKLEEVVTKMKAHNA